MDSLIKIIAWQIVMLMISLIIVYVAFDSLSVVSAFFGGACYLVANVSMIILIALLRKNKITSSGAMVMLEILKLLIAAGAVMLCFLFFRDSLNAIAFLIGIVLVSQASLLSGTQYLWKMK